MDASDPLAQLTAPPVFVIGPPRSGTTWVYDICTVHPEVVGVYESFLFTTHDGFGSLFGEVQWRDRGGERFGLGQMVERSEVIAEVRRLSTTWLARALGPEHRFLVEKSPSHVDVVELIDEILPDSRFVYVQRDPRDVLVSQRAAASSWAKEWKKKRRLPMNLPPYLTAKAWAASYERSQQLAADLGPDRFLVLDYEDIKREPRASFKTLFDFCGFPYDDALLDEVYERTDFDRLYQGGEDQFRRGGRVGDWKRRFTLFDGAAYEAGSGGALVRAGYERARSWWWHLPPWSRRGR
ncbi:MAG TPA: sulfotransferase [Acidimicrobiales bacterium]|nr:sulfotransferase [Acidimicrobiales bacterium]